VFDLAVLLVSKYSRLDESLGLATVEGAMLAAAIVCAGAKDGTPSRAAKSTIENGALHMNFPLLEQAEVCLPSLQSAIVRMAHELFSGFEFCILEKHKAALVPFYCGGFTKKNL